MFTIIKNIFLGLFCLSLSHTSLAQSKELNLGFEQIDPHTGLPQGWSVDQADGVECNVDSLIKRNGKYALHIKRTETAPKKDIYYRLSLPCAIPKGVEVEWGLNLYTKNVKSPGQVILFLTFDNFCMCRSISNLTAGWKQHSIHSKTLFPIKNIVATIGFEGNGELWLDDAVLKVGGKEINNKDSLFLGEIKEKPVGMDFIVSPGKPLNADETEIKWGLVQLTDSLLALPADSVPKHPATNFYPGRVASEAKRTDRKILINHQPIQDNSQLHLSKFIRGNEGEIWHSTGLYAPPGERVVIEIPKHLKNKMSIQIGAHQQRLLKTMNTIWKRMPCIFNKRALTESETTIANPFGGMVYILYDPTQPAFSGKIKISGGVNAPHYVLGKTSDEEWQKMLESTGAPWGEFETGTMIFTLPVDVLRRINAPQQLADKWDHITRSMAELAQIDDRILRKQRIITDVSLGIQVPTSAGWAIGTANYPIYIREDKSYNYNSHEVILNPYTENQTSGEPMLYPTLHELGHNFQSENWNLEDMVEVTNNLFVLYIYDSVFGNRNGANSCLTDLSPKELFMCQDLSEWEKYPRLGFLMFQFLQEDFGWAPFKVVFGRFNADTRKGIVFDEQGKKDCWVLYLSEAVKKNLVPYFEKWNIKVSLNVKKAVSKYPGWMPMVITRMK